MPFSIRGHAHHSKKSQPPTAADHHRARSHVREQLRLAASWGPPARCHLPSPRTSQTRQCQHPADHTRDDAGHRRSGSSCSACATPACDRAGHRSRLSVAVAAQPFVRTVLLVEQQGWPHHLGLPVLASAPNPLSRAAVTCIALHDPLSRFLLCHVRGTRTRSRVSPGHASNLAELPDCTVQ